MFFPQRWALAFIHAAPGAGAAAEGLEFIRALGPVIRSARGHLAGTDAALRLERMVRAARAGTAGSLPPADAGGAAREAGAPREAEAGAAGGPGALSRAEELALCLMLLLIKKDLFKYVDQVAAAIERELDGLRGVLRAGLESARPVEEEFREELKRLLARKTGAAEIRLDLTAAPELLAGYRLRIGGRTIETSLRLYLRQLGTELAAAYPGTGDEGGAAQGGL
jgi:hypothetical protein